MLTDNGGLAMFGIYRKQARNRKKSIVTLKIGKKSIFTMFLRIIMSRSIYLRVMINISCLPDRDGSGASRST